MTPSLHDLRAALRTGDLASWLAAVEAAGASRSGRDALVRAIEHDRGLWSELPDSLASGLLARTLGVAGLEGVRAAWLRETEAAGRPWVRPLSPLPLPAGLVATLGSGDAVELRGLQRLQFPDEDTVALESIRFHPTVQAPELRREERLRWRWRTGELGFEPDPDREPATPYPCFKKDGWGPVSMRVDASSEPVELPCPPEGSADAQLARDGRTIIVYGSHEEYAGGFVWFVRPWPLVVERALETPRPVSDVHESADGQVVLARTFGGLVCWTRDGRELSLPLRGESAALSPSGERIAVRTGRTVQVWSVAEATGGVRAPGFPARFSPRGARLLRGTTLHDGVSGRAVAALEATFGRYLEGGSAQPWFHVGDELVVSLSRVQVWRAADGARLETPGERRNPLNRLAHWNKVAYDARGRRLAVIQLGQDDVTLLALPSGEVEAKLTFDLKRLQSVALSPSGERVAVAEGGAIEVRTRAGELVLGASHPDVDGASARPRIRDASLRFDGEDRVVSHLPEDGWRAFSLIDGSSERCGEPGSRPPGWRVVEGGHTVFVHEATGTRIALPVDGDWAVHPTRPTVLACDEAHVELVG